MSQTFRDALRADLGDAPGADAIANATSAIATRTAQVGRVADDALALARAATVELEVSTTDRLRRHAAATQRAARLHTDLLVELRSCR